VAVAYDDTAGTLDATYTFHSDVSSDTCGNTNGLTQYVIVASCSSASAVPAASIQLGRRLGAAEPYISMTLPGINGTLTGTASYSSDGRSIVGSLSNPMLAGRDWRCVDSGDSFDTVDRFYFAGYEPAPPPVIPPAVVEPPTFLPVPVPVRAPAPRPQPERLVQASLSFETAAAFLTAELTRVYGATFSESKRKWVKCPSVAEYEDEDGQPYVLCQYDFQVRGNTYRAGAVSVVLNHDESALAFSGEGLDPRSYSRKLVRCRSRELRATTLSNRYRLASQRLTAQRGDCAYIAGVRTLDIAGAAVRRYPRPLRTLSVYFTHTQSAGFGDTVTYRCKARGRYSVSCKNAIGNSFRYSFKLTRKAAPKPRPTARPRPSRPSRPSAPSSPYSDVENCSDTSARDFPTPPGDPNGLDGDNDGVACES